jgi:hypothetical protein
MGFAYVGRFDFTNSMPLLPSVDIQGSPSITECDLPLIDLENPPTIGLRVANSCVTAKAIGANLLRHYASQVGFTSTFHVSTHIDKQGRSRRVDISCIQGGKPRSTAKIANPSVSCTIKKNALNV